MSGSSVQSDDVRWEMRDARWARFHGVLRGLHVVLRVYGRWRDVDWSGMPVCFRREIDSAFFGQFEEMLDCSWGLVMQFFFE